MKFAFELDQIVVPTVVDRRTSRGFRFRTGGFIGTILCIAAEGWRGLDPVLVLLRIADRTIEQNVFSEGFPQLTGCISLPNLE
ncbi:MAG: hypothetical protein KDK37_14445 [Leptospiraceae bacterium]|nr:hypothetical protein [Leptospiraceae bacterium]